MLQIFDILFGSPISIILAICTVCYLYLKWQYTYWERQDFPFLKPRMLFGNLENPLTRKTGACMELKKFYDDLKSRGFRHGGVYYFSTPVYIPVDLEYIRNILSNDFHHFVERGRYYNEKDDPLSAHLFNIGGTRWKHLRTKCTPTFTSAKMKMMFSSLLTCGESLKSAMDLCCTQAEPVEIKDIANKFTIDVIGFCVFGIQCNAFTSSDSKFLKCGHLIFKTSVLEAALLAFTFSFPDLCRRLGVRRYNKEATRCFFNIIRDTVQHRESNNIRACDFLQILIDLKNESETKNNSTEKKETNLTIEQIAAQATVFYIGGYDTSATAISFALYEMALNPEIQQKAREEVNQILDTYGGKLGYESIAEMKYLQQVMDETLRKYPSLPLLNRQCVETYRFPKSHLVLEKGTQIIIPLLGLHRDAEYFPDPEKFDPERFSDENKLKIKPFSYLPFGDGPRNCIGMRFGVMQTKFCLAMLLKDYKFLVNPKTSSPLEMGLGPMCTVKGGIWLDISKVD